MRKLFALLGLVGMLVMACGGAGGGASNPEAAVNGAFNALKSGDLDAMVQYMPVDERSEITDMSDEEREMAEGMLAMMAALEFEVKGSVVTGETAVVTVEMTFMGQTEEEEVELMLENGNWVITSGGIL